MTRTIGLVASAATVALFLMAAPAAQAADLEDPGCSLSGSVMAGIMLDWQELDFNGEDKVDVDWTTPFGEGAGLATCGGLNIQADIAYYGHSGDYNFEFGDENDVDRDSSHIGGALFYRDPVSWAAGVQASWISQSIFGIDIDVFRIGLFGELYVGESFTLGGNVAYHDGDSNSDFDIDQSGFEFAAYGRFYATPDLSLTLRGDILLADTGAFGDDGDLTGYAISGEAEYLVWDQGLSLFAGARYAERNHNLDFTNEFHFDSDDMQVFGGIKFYFGQDGTLVERQRTGPVDNTSVFEEKLPNTLFDFPS
jgi:hypothetical protein